MQTVESYVHVGFDISGRRVGNPLDQAVEASVRQDPLGQQNASSSATGRVSGTRFGVLHRFGNDLGDHLRAGRDRQAINCAKPGSDKLGLPGVRGVRGGCFQIVGCDPGPLASDGARLDDHDLDPELRHFDAQAVTQPSTANLLAWYQLPSGSQILPPMEEMFTMYPSRWARIWGSTS